MPRGDVNRNSGSDMAAAKIVENVLKRCRGISVTIVKVFRVVVGELQSVMKSWSLQGR